MMSKIVRINRIYGAGRLFGRVARTIFHERGDRTQCSRRARPKTPNIPTTKNEGISNNQYPTRPGNVLRLGASLGFGDAGLKLPPGAWAQCARRSTNSGWQNTLRVAAAVISFVGNPDCVWLDASGKFLPEV
jgi:hypothetical protein